MTMSSNGNIFCTTGLCAGNSQVTGEFPSQRPVMRSFDVFFDLYLNKQLSKQSIHRWFETQLCTLWRHCSVHPPISVHHVSFPSAYQARYVLVIDLDVKHKWVWWLSASAAYLMKYAHSFVVFYETCTQILQICQRTENWNMHFTEWFWWKIK